jgi:ACS family hexuronate transporter-like MFS transporter
MLGYARMTNRGETAAHVSSEPLTPPQPTAERRSSVIRGLRWWIISLIFLITCINYIDRTSIGLLFTRFGVTLHISTEQYSWVGALLLLAYTTSQAISGRLYDSYGAKIGFTASVILWSVAAMAHAAIMGFTSFAICSFMLGLGEAGNWPGAAKVVAEWFPESERSLGMAVFNGGASMGGVVGPLLVASLLEPAIGWRWTFIVIGFLGIVWLVAWLIMYRPLASHPNVSREEREFIFSGQRRHSEQAIPIRELLRLRPTWGILLARFFVDPVWWLYMLWLPSYLKDVHHLNLRTIGLFQWAPYLCAAIGSLAGGLMSWWLIRRGHTVNFGRKSAMTIAACMMPAGILAARAESPYVALGLIGVVLFAFQMWISNVQTLPSDYFANASIGSVAGLGGMAAGISSLLFNLGTGWLVTNFGYAAVLSIAGLLAPIGVLSFIWVAGPVRRLQNG